MRWPWTRRRTETPAPGPTQTPVAEAAPVPVQAPAREPAYRQPAAPPADLPPTSARRGFSWGSLAVRFLLSLLGAAGLVFGAFLVWVHQSKAKGVDVSARAFFESNFTTHAQFAKSLGFAFIILGLLAIVGMAFRSGWLTSLVGALGIVGFVLFIIELHRSNASLPGSIGPGAWIALTGGLLALVGGILGARARPLAR
jgi:hypothetical protein